MASESVVKRRSILLNLSSRRASALLIPVAQAATLADRTPAVPRPEEHPCPISPHAAQLRRRRARRPGRRPDRRPGRPDARRGVRHGAGLRPPRTSTRRMRRRRRRRSRPGATRTPGRAAEGAAADRRRDRGARRRAGRRREREHRQAAGADARRRRSRRWSTRSGSSPAPRGCSRAGRPASTWPATPRIIRREPIGVCAQVTPWNYPMMMAVWKFAPAHRRGQHRGAQAVRHHAGLDRC